MGFIKHQIPPFFRRRTFSDKLSDTNDFITANWRPLLKMLTVVILPVCAIMPLCFRGILSTYGQLYYSNDQTGIIAKFIFYVVVMIILLIISLLFVTSIVYALIKLYHATNEDGTPVNENLSKMTIKEFMPYARQQMGATLKSIFAYILWCFALITIVAMIIFFVLRNSIPESLSWIIQVCGQTLSIPAMFLLPVYSFEHIGLFSGIRKAIVYGFKTWRGIFAVYFVFSIITNIISGFCSLPFIITLFLKIFFATGNVDNLAFTSSIWFNFVCYLTAIFALYAIFVCGTAMLIAIAYQYGHACSVLDTNNFDNEDKDFDDFDKDAANEDNF